jgi:hypothetical protein
MSGVPHKLALVGMREEMEYVVSSASASFPRQALLSLFSL